MGNQESVASIPRKARIPRPGQDVIVWWLDSGLSEEADPAGPFTPLRINKTHGTVISCKEDQALSASLRPGQSARTLRLAMCSSGNGDDQTEIAAIYWPCVVRIKAWKDE